MRQIRVFSLTSLASGDKSIQQHAPSRYNAHGERRNLIVAVQNTTCRISP
ncbi:hypothetical protein LSAT2_027572, partial [Lamellibrachia satsuma]